VRSRRRRQTTRPDRFPRDPPAAGRPSADGHGNTNASRWTMRSTMRIPTRANSARTNRVERRVSEWGPRGGIPRSRGRADRRSDHREVLREQVVGAGVTRGGTCGAPSTLRGRDTRERPRTAIAQARRGTTVDARRPSSGRLRHARLGHGPRVGNREGARGIANRTRRRRLRSAVAGRSAKSSRPRRPVLSETSALVDDGPRVLVPTSTGAVTRCAG